jgi:hypothetical protein
MKDTANSAREMRSAMGSRLRPESISPITQSRALSMRWILRRGGELNET